MQKVWLGKAGLTLLGLAASVMACADSTRLTDTEVPTGRAPLAAVSSSIDPALTSCSAPTIAATNFDDGSWGSFRSDTYTLFTDGQGKAVQHSWPAGRSGYASVDAAYTGVTRVYASWRYRQDAGFDNTPSHQLLKFYRPGWNGGVGLLQISGDRFRWYYDQLDSQDWFYQNVGSEIRPSQLRGDWHWFELMNDISASGALRVRLWIDGELKMDQLVARPNNGLTIGVTSFGGPMNAPSSSAYDAFDDLAVSTGCVGAPASSGSTTSVASVSVSPASASLVAGDSTQLTAAAKDASGNLISGSSFTWSSSNPAVATVSATGLVKAVAAGSVTITATSGGQSGSSSITVSNVPVASVSVTLDKSSIQVGQTAQATAVAKDANGNTLTGRTVAWSSSNAGVATVSSTGVVTGVSAGTAMISATVEGQVGSASISVLAASTVSSVTVTPPADTLQVGQTAQLSATVRDQSGNVMTGQTVTWSSSNTAVATVSSSGVVTGVAAGSATVRATSGTVSGSSAITVTSSTSTSPPTSSCPSPDIMSWGFNDGTWGPFKPGGYTLTQDPTAIGGWSATHTWYRTGSESYASINSEFAGVRRVYARWRYKQDPNFEDSTAIKKLLFTKGPGYTFGTGLLVISRDRFMWYYDQLGDGQTNYFSNVGTEIRPSQLRGGWHWLELMNDISTSGALHVQFWIDGVLKMDHVVAFSNQGQTIGTLQFNGTTNAPGTNGTDWLDELAVSTQCIAIP